MDRMHLAGGTPTAVMEASSAIDHRPHRRERSSATTGHVAVVEFSDAERDEMARALDEGFLAEVVERRIPVDSPAFFDLAETVEGVLPGPARTAIAALRRGDVAAVILRGLPGDEDPGPTPNERAARPVPPARGHAWNAVVMRKLGYELGYRSEKRGAVMHDVYPTPQGADSQSNESSKSDLQLHTENAFHPIRPDFVALYCVRTPPDSPATKLALLDDILPVLTDQEVQTLREKRFVAKVVDSFRYEGEDDHELQVQVLAGPSRRPSTRWHCTWRGADETAQHTAQSFAEAADAVSTQVPLGEGDLLVFNNELCLHGRVPFEARFDGSDRWLLRGYILRDPTTISPFVTAEHPRVVHVDLAASAAT